jgi:hypothetical protein
MCVLYNQSIFFFFFFCRGNKKRKEAGNKIRITGCFSGTFGKEYVVWCKRSSYTTTTTATVRQ